MGFHKKLVVLALVKCVTCLWDTIEDRNSELNDASRQRDIRKFHMSNFDGMESFHVDKEINDKYKSVLFADCFDIDMGPMAKRCLRQIFELGRVNWTIDSAATSPKYVGKPMTKRMADFLRSRNQTLRGHRVRLITQDDFRKYDWIVAIDETTRDYLNKIKPNDTKALIEEWDDYDYYKDGHPGLLDINNMQKEEDYLNCYHHNLRLASIFLGNNMRCRTCYPIDFKKSEKYWDEVQAKK